MGRKPEKIENLVSSLNKFSGVERIECPFSSRIIIYGECYDFTGVLSKITRAGYAVTRYRRKEL